MINKPPPLVRIQNLRNLRSDVRLAIRAAITGGLKGRRVNIPSVFERGKETRVQR